MRAIAPSGIRGHAVGPLSMDSCHRAAKISKRFSAWALAASECDLVTSGKGGCHFYMGAHPLESRFGELSLSFR